jgi:hypothetical protein
MGRLAELAAAVRPPTVAETYEQCRLIDQQISLVRRIWRWFADKYDQRDDSSLAGTLAAADEVIWAVHAEVHRACGADPVPPAPLPYIDEAEAPEAVPRDEPTAELRPGGFDDLLASTLARLPIPVVGLPPTGPDGPAALVLLGHEVGHHLLYDLEPSRQLLAALGEAVQRKVGPPEGARWRAWSQEVFADLVGLAALGPSLVTSLLRYELGTQEHLLDRGRGRYPAPAVRLALLAELARRLGLPAGDAQGELDPRTWYEDAGDGLDGRRAAVRTDMAQLPRVASALLAFTPREAGTIPELLAFDAEAHAADGRIARRAEQLLTGAVFQDSGLAEVRELTSAGAIAWRRLEECSEADEKRRSEFTAATFARLVAAREPGTRAAGDELGTVPDDQLVAFLATPPNG